MSDDFNLSQLGFSAATRARNDANNAQQEANSERQRALIAEAALRNVTTDADLERKVRGLGIEKERLLSSVSFLQQQLAERDANLNEWKHSCEAFRRLAKQYGAVVGVSDEQRSQDYENHIAKLVDEDPKFAQTKLGQKVRLNSQS